MDRGVVLAAIGQTALALQRLDEARRRVSKGRALKPIMADVEAAMEAVWKKQGRLTLKGFEKMQKVWPVTEAGRRQAVGLWLREAGVEDEVDGIFEKAAGETADFMGEALTAAAEAGLEAGAVSMAGTLGVRYAFDLANPRAVAWLKDYGALRVALIDQATMADLRVTVSYAVENGWSYSKTARSIQERFKGYYEPGSYWNFDALRPQGHIASRAHLIAVTESGEAYEAGNYVVVEDLAASGIQMQKKWSTMGDDRVSDECRLNEDEGWIAHDQAHVSGHQHPLRFPGCRCDEYYEVRG